MFYLFSGEYTMAICCFVAVAEGARKISLPPPSHYNAILPHPNHLNNSFPFPPFQIIGDNRDHTSVPQCDGCYIVKIWRVIFHSSADAFPTATSCLNQVVAALLASALKAEQALSLLVVELLSNKQYPLLANMDSSLRESELSLNGMSKD